MNGMLTAINIIIGSRRKTILAISSGATIPTAVAAFEDAFVLLTNRYAGNYNTLAAGAKSFWPERRAGVSKQH